VKGFVVHYKKLGHRRKSLTIQLEAARIPAVFVDHIDRDSILEHDLAMFDRRRKYWLFGRRIRPVDMAITLSHLHCLQLARERAEASLILEDDAILAEGFSGSLSQCHAQLPAGWDLCFLGDGCGFHIPENQRQPGIFAYEKGHGPTDWGGAGATRCTDSYLVTSAAANRILQHAACLKNSVRLPYDWWLNDVIRLLGLRVYWAEPTMVTQGSQSVYKSSY
jgi:GR25 family glycosyltransferase involved in LPS biosynthesis